MNNNANSQLAYPRTNPRPDCSFGASIPQESCLHQSADELLKFVSELENKTGRIDDVLFGARPAPLPEIRSTPESLQQKIAEACTRVANLCGLAGTIGNKLAGE